MNWTFQQYQAQPQWLIDLIMPTAEVEKKVEDIKLKNEQERQNRGR